MIERDREKARRIETGCEKSEELARDREISVERSKRRQRTRELERDQEGSREIDRDPNVLRKTGEIVGDRKRSREIEGICIYNCIDSHISPEARV